MLKYIELKTGFNDNGPAWIANVTESKSRRSIYFNGKCFTKSTRVGSSGNYYDIETSEAYWISGIKKDGHDRHWAGSGKISIEASVVDEYLRIRDIEQLDPSRFLIVDPFTATDPAKFHERQNRTMPRQRIVGNQGPPNQAL